MSASDAAYAILGMRIDELRVPRYLEQIDLWAQRGRRGYCCVTNVHQCVLTTESEEFGGVVDGASLVITDSTVLQRSICVKYGVDDPGALRGAEILLELSGRAAKAGYPVGFIGGKDTGVLNRLTDRLKELHADLDVGLAYSPPFRDLTAEERASLVEEINASGVKLLFVGLGCPKQERWMAAFSPLVSPMMIGLGAAFDFVSGEVVPSPAWVHRAGLDWLYRLIREPRRLWRRYWSTSPKFVVMWLSEALRERFRRAEGIAR